MMKFLFK